MPPSLKPPVKPRLSRELVPASLPEHRPEDDGHLHGLAFQDLTLADLDVHLLDVTESTFDSVDLSGSRLSKTTFADCRFTESDLANVQAIGSSLIRTELNGLRMTGLGFADGTVREVTFDRCRLDLSVFRFSTFSKVVFDGCSLRQADFGNADLRGVQFKDCDLTGAKFAQAKLQGARLTSCVLDQIGNVENLRGATIDAADLVALSYALAGALGIAISEEAAGPRSAPRPG